MQTSITKCTACNYQSSSMISWGARSYLLDTGEEIDLEWNLGWCFVCKSLSLIESFEDRDAIISEIDQYSECLHSGFRHTLKYAVSSSYKQDVQRLNTLKKRLQIIEHRKGKELCLLCGSQKVHCFSSDEAEAIKQKSQPTTKHPNCTNNGKLFSEAGIYFRASSSPRFYNINGLEIRNHKKN